MTLGEEEFETLYTQTRDQILGYLLRRCDRPEDAADLLGEVYLVAWRRRHSLPGGDEARLWLYGTARRVLANHRRGRRRHQALAERLRVEVREYRLGLPGPEDRDSDGLADLLRALGQLSENDREIILLAGWEELDPSEIATVLDIRPGTARARLHRARHRLRHQLDERSGTGPPITETSGFLAR